MRSSLYIFLMFILTAVALQTLGDQEDRKCLSKHETVAVFEGPKEENEELKRFRIIRYSNFEQHSGNEECKQEFFDLSYRSKDISPHILSQIKETSVGDTVYLSFRHDYVTTEDEQFPERVITHYKRKL